MGGERSTSRNSATCPSAPTVFDMDGNLYSNLRISENRVVVPIDKVSKNFLQALVAREDSRFYSHHGVDPHGIARAVVRNITRHRAAEGASTLTQQLARNSLPLGGKTLTRKILEAFVAVRIERHYSKQQILEFYVNRIFYGGGLYGIETASQAYFGKPSAQLDLSESAMMAGLIRSPNRFSPLEQPRRRRPRARHRARAHGRAAHDHRPRRSNTAKHETIKVARNRPSGVQDNYAMDAVQNELSGLLTDEQTDEGGLKIYTTIDPRDAEARHAGRRAAVREDREPPRLRAPQEGPEPGRRREQGHGLSPGRAGAHRQPRGRDPRARRRARIQDTRASTAPRTRRAARSARRSSRSSTPPRGSAACCPARTSTTAPSSPANSPTRPTGTPATPTARSAACSRRRVGLIRSRNTMSVRVGELVGLDDRAQGRPATPGWATNMPAEPTIFLGTFNTTLPS